MKLDRNASTPLHSQIQNFLRDRIASSKLKSDELVPSERELAEELQVSRMTVRQALNALCEEGLLYRKPGKGTYVSPIKVNARTRNIGGFAEEMTRRGMKPRSKVLHVGKDIAVVQAAEKLKLPLKSEVYCIKILRIADEIPMSVETSWLPIPNFPNLERLDFEKHSLYELFEKEYGINTYSAAEDLEAAISDEESSKLLQIRTKSPLLVIYRTVFGEENKPIEYTKSAYRADRYHASFYSVKK